MAVIAANDPAQAVAAARAFSRHPLLRFVVRRLAIGAIMLLAVSVVVFLATQALPGDAARAVLGRAASPERLRALRRLLHLDRPVAEQYWDWLWGVISGRPGISLVNGRPVLDYVVPRAANSGLLLLFSALIVLPMALMLGIWAALKQGRPVDMVVSTASLVLAALPEFVVGIILTLVFATSVFHWLPPVSLVPPGSAVLDDPKLLVLPVATLSLVCFPYVFRMMRAAMIDVLRSDYFEMATLKGIGPARLIFVHCLPNALAPVVQVIALTLAYLAGGVVLVEIVFAYPGVGQGLLTAIATRDLPTVQFIALALAAIYLLLNVAADLVTILLTPKLRVGPW